MRKFLGGFFAILILSVCAFATDITFTSSGTITDGNVFENVFVQNDGTVIDMSGGQINYGLYTWDASVFNMSGGSILGTSIGIAPVSTFKIYGDGTIDSDGSLAVDADATVNISGGNISAGVLKTYPGFPTFSIPASVVNINGGILNFNAFDIKGTLNIYRGLLNVNDSYISYSGYPTYTLADINIYGSGFNYNSSTQILTGYLLDNNQFTIKGIDESEYTRFNLIPEPMSLLLFGFSLLALRRQK